ncbi:MAG: hypothetical protein IJ762_04260 [Bacteroidaceae bacterium]|nr:hypothetical protein [Bacteroidaceae bacterium]MBR1788391.1 hypothetical protein [Bacteroidaceae bacterium]
MSMYFCHYTFEGSKHPKFLDEAIHLLTSAQNKVFIDSNDVEILAFKVKEALETAKPKGSTAHVYKHVPDNGDINVSVYKDEASENSVGRAHFAPVRAFVTWDMDDEKFIEVDLTKKEKRK